MHPVLITTKHRGVFFGNSECPAEDIGYTVVLHDCRNCLSWSQDMGGFLGLATLGPSDTCRIGTEATNVKLFDVTSATAVSAKGAVRWKNS